MSAGVEREGIILPELRFTWDSLERFPNHHDFRTCLCEKKTQILPDVFDAFQ